MSRCSKRIVVIPSLSVYVTVFPFSLFKKDGLRNLKIYLLKLPSLS